MKQTANDGTKVRFTITSNPSDAAKCNTFITCPDSMLIHLINPFPAVEWARKDLTLRHSIQAYDALAWALYKKGDIPEAREEIAKALRTGAKDAHLLHHAGIIEMSAGDLVAGKAALQQAATTNPHYNSFHVHR